MIFITGPLYSGKRTFARTLPGRCIADVQQLAAGCKDNTELEKLADKLSAYDIVLSTEVGGGVVPIDPAERARGKTPGVWPVCWRHALSAWCRCSAASPPF